MPIEIRELVIKASVGKVETSAAANKKSDAASKEAMISEITEQVLSIIKEKSER